MMRLPTHGPPTPPGEFLREFPEDLGVSQSAVLTELFHLVGDSPSESDVVWRFVRSGVLTVHAIDDRDLA